MQGMSSARQPIAMPRRARLRWVWAAAMPALWALGWTVTALAGIGVSGQFAIFGAFGALTCATPVRPPAPSPVAHWHRPGPRQPAPGW